MKFYRFMPLIVTIFFFMGCAAKPRAKLVNITSIPPNAEISINGKQIGNTPLQHIFTDASVQNPTGAVYYKIQASWKGHRTESLFNNFNYIPNEIAFNLTPSKTTKNSNDRVTSLNSKSPKKATNYNEPRIYGNKPKKWAVVIGISDYQDSGIPALRYSATDARAFYNWLISSEGGRYAPSNIRLLLNNKATYNNIKDALFVWLNGALEEDMVIIYFAGHGSPATPDAPNNLFLLPYDTNYKAIAATGFPMWDIETALKRFIKARKVVVIADACHSGGVGHAYDIARRAIHINPINTSFHGLSKISDGVCVMSATDNQQFSQESQIWGNGHGVFTYFLLKGLKGEADYNKDKTVSLGELTSFVSEHVRRETKNAQSPTVAGRYDPALKIQN